MEDWEERSEHYRAGTESVRGPSASPVATRGTRCALCPRSQQQLHRIPTLYLHPLCTKCAVSFALPGVAYREPTTLISAQQPVGSPLAVGPKYHAPQCSHTGGEARPHHLHAPAPRANTGRAVQSVRSNSHANRKATAVCTGGRVPRRCPLRCTHDNAEHRYTEGWSSIGHLHNT